MSGSSFAVVGCKRDARTGLRASRLARMVFMTLGLWVRVQLVLTQTQQRPFYANNGFKLESMSTLTLKPDKNEECPPQQSVSEHLQDGNRPEPIADDDYTQVKPF